MGVYYAPLPEQARYSCRSIHRNAQYSRSITSLSARSCRTALKACVLAVAAAISASAGAAYVESITNADYGNSYPPKIELTEETTASEINIDVQIPAKQSNFTVTAAADPTVTGTTKIHLTSNELADGWDQATHALYSSTAGTTIALKGNVDLSIQDSPELIDVYGANTLYLTGKDIQATLGSEGTKTRLGRISQSRRIFHRPRRVPLLQDQSQLDCSDGRRFGILGQFGHIQRRLGSVRDLPRG